MTEGARRALLAGLVAGGAAPLLLAPVLRGFVPSGAAGLHHVEVSIV